MHSTFTFTSNKQPYSSRWVSPPFLNVPFHISNTNYYKGIVAQVGNLAHLLMNHISTYVCMSVS